MGKACANCGALGVLLIYASDEADESSPLGRPLCAECSNVDLARGGIATRAPAEAAAPPADRTGPKPMQVDAGLALRLHRAWILADTKAAHTKRAAEALKHHERLLLDVGARLALQAAGVPETPELLAKVREAAEAQGLL